MTDDLARRDEWLSEINRRYDLEGPWLTDHSPRHNPFISKSWRVFLYLAVMAVVVGTMIAINQ